MSGSLRAQQVLGAARRARLDGTVLVCAHATGDILVDGSAIRPLTHVLAAGGAAAGCATMLYTLAGGIEAIDAPGGPKASPPTGLGDATPATVVIDRAVEACRQAAVPHTFVIDFGDHILPPNELAAATGDTARIVEQIAAVSDDVAWSAAGHQLVIVARTAGLTTQLGAMPRVTIVDLGLPQEAERRLALDLMRSSRRHALHLAPDLDVARAARLAGGMSISRLSDMRLHTSAAAPLTLDAIIHAKGEAIRRSAGSTLTVHDEPLRLDVDVAGLHQVRRWLAEEVGRGSHTLRAILAGPPGTGKTRVATAIAGELGVPALELGSILGRYVGESEENLRRALDVIAANAPCLLILDEVDETFLGRRGTSSSDGDGGGQVTANLRAALFAWLGDVGTDDGISVIGLTNRPDRLDEAASDRFSVIPVLHPSPAEAADIMAIQARRHGTALDRDGAHAALAASPASFSGRHAVRLLGRAQVHAIADGDAQVGEAHVAAAIREAMHAMGREEERQALLAIRATTWAGHLPWNAARHLGDAVAAPPPYLLPHVRTDGTVDTASIEHRLVELAGPR